MHQETTTLTAQELALYLGCEVTAGDAPEILDTVGQNGDVETLFRGRESMRNCYKIEDIKPILRPLSDITEEEIKGWAKLTNPELNLEYANADIQHSLAMVQRKGKDAFCFDGATPEQAFLATKYLLSCGFDLFNWIEQGKAISKSTL